MGANTLVSRPRPIRVTWRFLSRDHLIPKSHFLVYVLYCNWVSISNHFRDNGHFLYLGHDLDLSRSRDVIGDVTNRSAICHFLLVSYCNRTSISNRFRDIRPPIPVRARTHTHTHTHTQTRRKWFYILSHAMYCIGQTITYFTMNVSIITERVSIWPK